MPSDWKRAAAEEIAKFQGVLKYLVSDPENDYALKALAEIITRHAEPLEKDRSRLDWLCDEMLYHNEQEENDSGYFYLYVPDPKSDEPEIDQRIDVRAAIDAAREREGGEDE